MAFESMRQALKERREAKQALRILGDTNANLNVSAGLTIAGLVLAAVVGALILANIAPTFFSAVNDTSDAFATADVGDATANTIANTVFPLIISLAGVFAIAGLAFGVFKLSRK